MGPIVSEKGTVYQTRDKRILRIRFPVRELQLTISGGNDEGVTPVPIPNTEVKPFSADGTWLVTARESRSPPDSK